MNDLMTSLNLSKLRNVIRVIDTRLAVFVIQDKIQTNVRIFFKVHVSYDNIKNLNAIIWENFHDSSCSHLPDDTKESYDLSNYTKVPINKKVALTMSNINSFHGRFSVLSALRSPFKLKINCSSRFND